MIRNSVLLLLLLLAAGCGRQQEAPKPKPEQPAQPPSPSSPRAQPSAGDRQLGEDAARALRHYYALIGAGDYRQAYRLRTPGGADEARFAANFAAYER